MPRATFTWDLETDRLVWSHGMQRLYGYDDAPTEISPELLFSHKHPDDVPRLQWLLERTRRQLKPFVYRTHIRTAAGQTRSIALAVEPGKAERGAAVELIGTVIDLTHAVLSPTLQRDEEDSGALRERVRNLEVALATRDIIGQAKGVLMSAHRITEQQAFDLMRVASQNTHRKLHEIAEEIARTGVIDL